jgi:hypothetical protein
MTDAARATAIELPGLAMTEAAGWWRAVTARDGKEVELSHLSTGNSE